MSKDVVIVSGVRTAIGSFGGSLSSLPPTELGALVAKEAISRAGIESEKIGHVAFGHVINTEPSDMYLSRVAAIKAEIPVTTPAMNVNRLCGSGAQAIVSVFQNIALGDAEFGLAGGAENMSLSPHIMSSSRWGQKMGNTSLKDMMIGALNCPFGTGHMGVTAENVAKEQKISRGEQDKFAFQSQTRAKSAIIKGIFKKQIMPIEVNIKRKPILFETDEHPTEPNLESLGALKPAFIKEGSVTAGNSSGINDGAAAIVLASAETAKNNNLSPMARILSYSHSGVRPEVMGIGPVTAVQKLCEKIGLKIDDFDVIESNEAFAAQACAVNKSLGLDPKKVNPNGGAIALGHPVGATGTILVVKAIYELKRINGRYGLITMCIGGGQGIAIAVENFQ